MSPRQRPPASRQPLWFDLPTDLAGVVLLRLPSHADRVRFGSVCRQWCHAATTAPPPLPPALPWLNFHDGTLQSFPGGERRRFSRLNRHTICAGSTAAGWLLFRRPGHGPRRRHYLKNPLTGEVVRLPGHCHCGDPARLRRQHPPGSPTAYFYIRKVIVCGGGGLVVARISYSHDNADDVVACCRPGTSPSWSAGPWEGKGYHDMAFHDGKVYTVAGRGDLFAHEITTHRKTKQPMVSDLATQIIQVGLFESFLLDGTYAAVRCKRLHYLVMSKQSNGLMFISRAWVMRRSSLVQAAPWQFVRRAMEVMWKQFVFAAHSRGAMGLCFGIDTRSSPPPSPPHPRPQPPPPGSSDLPTDVAILPSPPHPRPPPPPCWSDLPTDLAGQWRLGALRQHPLPPPPPWLLILRSPCVYQSLPDGELRPVPGANSSRAIPYFSSYDDGWLLEYQCFGRRDRIRNPLSRAAIDIPRCFDQRIRSLDYFLGDNDGSHSINPAEYTLPKIIVCSPGLVVAAVVHSTCIAAFRPGIDHSWSVISGDEVMSTTGGDDDDDDDDDYPWMRRKYEDISLYRGKLYALTSKEELLVHGIINDDDIDTVSANAVLSRAEHAIRAVHHHPLTLLERIQNFSSDESRYLVISCSGKLLMIRCTTKYSPDGSSSMGGTTIKFKVFEADFWRVVSGWR
ncbi:hypothetical protein OsI_37526 [Oryza sativa Indica Group]|uniref:KIB1-4 beta-propeller domain-containing protein n=1 Tax=Oryza sativa subsp. indica TaxID=39946 RepID=B8BN95_ORYSI|nr:hypothetical protein OsI_37526 [Oryza sativa Indica Group]